MSKILFRSLTKLASKNYIDYVLLVQFSRFILSPFVFSDFYIITFSFLVVNKFFITFYLLSEATTFISYYLQTFLSTLFCNVFKEFVLLMLRRLSDK